MDIGNEIWSSERSPLQSVAGEKPRCHFCFWNPGCDRYQADRENRCLVKCRWGLGGPWWLKLLEWFRSRDQTNPLNISSVLFYALCPFVLFDFVQLSLDTSLECSPPLCAPSVRCDNWESQRPSIITIMWRTKRCGVAPVAPWRLCEIKKQKIQCPNPHLQRRMRPWICTFV